MIPLAGSGIPGVAVLVLGALLVVVLIGFAISVNGARKELLSRVALRVGGTFVPGAWNREHRIDFPIAGRDASLTFFGGSKGHAPYSRVSASLGGLFPGTLHILEEGFGQRFLKIFGAQDLDIGDAAFDKDYVVKATPDRLAARIFAPERRSDVVRTVRRLSGFSNPSIDVTPQELTVTTRQYLRDETALLTLISAAQEFLAYVLGEPAPPGIVLGEVTSSGGGNCPVCGTGLRDRVVKCEGCRTPHHADCWAYMGRCSTYACRGVRSRA